MNGLNFGSLATTQTSSSTSYVRPYSIYEGVKFAGVEGPVTGTSQSGNSWKAYDFKFSWKDGEYSERIFEPTDKSTTRATVKNAQGHDVQLPSEWERTLAFIAQVGNTFNPEGYKKVQAASSKVSSFDQLIEVFKKGIGQPDTETKLKLGGRTRDGKTYAGLSTFVRINSKTGEAFTCDNFVGDKVAFSAYELQMKTQYENAKPTSVASAISTPSLNVDDSEKSEDDLDLDSLGL